MQTMTFKIPGPIREKLNTYSRKKGLSKSEIMRKALLNFFSSDKEGKKGSFFDLSSDIAGSISGKPYLSTRKPCQNGYGI
ncbi:MAG: hypothetical protein GF350_08495 [Chitinivibrionales bacterium]|nr:hypothetical protein [Chitinivibrionales bacterium]